MSLIFNPSFVTYSYCIYIGISVFEEKIKTKKPWHLITVLGGSPAVITESLYAMYAHEDMEFPEKITIFTTLLGFKKLINLECVATPRDFDGENHKIIDFYINKEIKKLCDEYDIPIDNRLIKIDDIVIITDENGEYLSDIRNEQDQKNMADIICQKVRIFALNEEYHLHASIAGGRKSMSFFLGYIFSLFARPEDKMSHVLVSRNDLEGTNFMFPPNVKKFNEKTPPSYDKYDKSKLVLTEEECGKPIVELADIPFVPLGNFIPNIRIDKNMSASSRNKNRSLFENYTKELKATLEENIELKYDPVAKKIYIGEDELYLNPFCYAYYSILIEVCKEGKEYIFSQERYWNENTWKSNGTDKSIDNVFYERLRDKFIDKYPNGNKLKDESGTGQAKINNFIKANIDNEYIAKNMKIKIDEDNDKIKEYKIFNEIKNLSDTINDNIRKNITLSQSNFDLVKASSATVKVEGKDEKTSRSYLKISKDKVVIG
ncbi:TIGR02584 family CRISPR-associated protein [Vibrio sp. F13]|nr:TIGR02584 family CRISPR-associated protein [Vibrio sp. F13]TKF56342.1 TIGR02584 family CRISPR-associated protein [Vibrio sp. F13]